MRMQLPQEYRCPVLPTTTELINTLKNADLSKYDLGPEHINILEFGSAKGPQQIKFVDND